jgi:hypothetical protein
MSQCQHRAAQGVPTRHALFSNPQSATQYPEVEKMMRLAENGAKHPVPLNKLNRVEEMHLASSVVEEFAAATLAVSLAEVEFSPLIRFKTWTIWIRYCGVRWRGANTCSRAIPRTT